MAKPNFAKVVSEYAKERNAALVALLEADARVTQMESELAEVKSSRRKAQLDAQAAGWSPTDFRNIGLSIPAPKRRKRTELEALIDHGADSQPDPPPTPEPWPN